MLYDCAFEVQSFFGGCIFVLGLVLFYLEILKIDMSSKRVRTCILSNTMGQVPRKNNQFDFKKLFTVTVSLQPILG